MRDIKFRGVTPTGCWVKGSLIYHGEQPQIQYVTRRHPDDNRVLDTDWAYVAPQTVGQYTERKDGKDNEIYDGDILQDDDDLKIVVFWNEMYMEWAYRRIDTGQTFAFAMSTQALSHFTVVGNIHDNPEMLTAKTM